MLTSIHRNKRTTKPILPKILSRLPQKAQKGKKEAKKALQTTPIK